MANILVVEDDHALNNAYRIILVASGHTVATAFNGKEALEKLNNFKPKLILLDLLMPVMGGLEFLQNYQRSKHSDVPILLFTNMEASSDVDMAYKLGIKSVIIKSMTTPQQLLKLVNSTLKK